jgi:DNA-directed RNA polymerase specialized sigma24 family protein
MAMREISSKHWGEADFRAVFVRLYARIVGILVHLLDDLPQAEEIANDAFLRLYGQPALQIDGNVAGWILSLTKITSGTAAGAVAGGTRNLTRVRVMYSRL